MPDATLIAVDDHSAMTRSLAELGEMIGLDVQTYESATEFLDKYNGERPACLVLDVRMPEMSGLQLQEHLAQQRSNLPIVMISGHADVPMAVEVMKKGAVTFLEKPFRMHELVEWIQQAIQSDREQQELLAQQRLAHKCIDSMTDKELQVFDMIADGLTNSDMASELRLTQRAIEDRRARVMKKLNASSLREVIAIKKELSGLTS